MVVILLGALFVRRDIIFIRVQWTLTTNRAMPLEKMYVAIL
jgi:hypothetical protein